MPRLTVAMLWVPCQTVYIIVVEVGNKSNFVPRYSIKSVTLPYKMVEKKNPLCARLAAHRIFVRQGLTSHTNWCIENRYSVNGPPSMNSNSALLGLNLNGAHFSSAEKRKTEAAQGLAPV